MALLPEIAIVEATPVKKVGHRSSPSGEIVLPSYSGKIDPETFDKFTDIIASNTDKIIELKLSIERSSKSQNRYYAGISDNQLAISGGDPMDHPCEVVINGPVGTTMDLLTVDGFYLVKSGGMHAAGALSWGLVPVDEAQIRLNSKIRIIKKVL